jgi:hypothetical protein
MRQDDGTTLESGPHPLISLHRIAPCMPWSLSSALDESANLQGWGQESTMSRAQTPGRKISA